MLKVQAGTRQQVRCATRQLRISLEGGQADVAVVEAAAPWQLGQRPYCMIRKHVKEPGVLLRVQVGAGGVPRTGRHGRP